jgi:hypothetical protein
LGNMLNLQGVFAPLQAANAAGFAERVRNE